MPRPYRRLALILALGTVAFPSAISAQPMSKERGPDLMLRTPGGRYEALDLPRDRYQVQPRADGNAAVYSRDGRRIGTIEPRPWGGAFYDNEGRRR